MQQKPTDPKKEWQRLVGSPNDNTLNQTKEHLRQQDEAVRKVQSQQVANNIVPPGNRLGMDIGFRSPPSLTEIFNRSSDPRVQIAAMQKKMSRPQATQEYSPKGSVTKSINTKQDLRLAETIKAMSEVLARQQRHDRTGSMDQKPEAKKSIELGKKNQIKQDFNQASGMGM